jgi:hypothetical protein
LTRISEKPLWYTFFQLEEKNTGYQFEKWVEFYEEWLDFKYELKESDLKRI